MKNGRKEWTACCLAVLCLTAVLVLCTACRLNYKPSDTPDISRNVTFDIEKRSLNLALGQTVDTADVLARCHCTVTDENGSVTVLTKEDLRSKDYTYNTFDTDKVGSFEVVVGYRSKNYVIQYDVEEYAVNFFVRDQAFLSGVKPTSALTEDLSLLCSLNLAEDYNYAMYPDMMENHTEDGLRFAGWTDADGNIVCGQVSLERPASGYQRTLNLYAVFLSDEEFSAHDIRYNGQNEKSFTTSRVSRTSAGSTFPKASRMWIWWTFSKMCALPR